MTFVEECIRDSMPIWESCLETEFLKGVADGSLSESCFKGYMVEDSLYLREYSKVFAWGIINSEDMEEIRNYYSLLSFVNESEDATRLYYLKRYGITDSEIQPLPLRPENKAYVDVMLKAAREGEGAPECMMACLPCMLSYGWIFKELILRAPGVKETPYWKFVSDYAGERYEDICKSWIDFADKVCMDITPERKKSCMEIFRSCSVCELHFWEMNAEPREDIF